jgi:putative ABC transport system substrate-binding protein
VEVLRPNDFRTAFAALDSRGAQAVLVHGSAMTYERLPDVISLAAKYRLPALYASREAPLMNGFMSYAPNIPDSFRRAASYVDRILKGAKPGELPIELPAKYELIINLRTAKALGLTIPASVLARADQVIEE